MLNRQDIKPRNLSSTDWQFITHSSDTYMTVFHFLIFIISPNGERVSGSKQKGRNGGNEKSQELELHVKRKR
jgi:hypothetical protein